MIFSRRQLLQQTIGFSAWAALNGGCRSSSPSSSSSSSAPRADRPADDSAIDARGCHLLAVGDFGVKPKDLPRQRAVSEAMALYAAKYEFRPAALALLGDNFYGGLAGKGVASPRWRTNVEAMYPPDAFACPMYAVLGNHDYFDEGGRASVAAQLAYRAHRPDSRWTLPAKQYRFELPAQNPLATFVVIDTNGVYGDRAMSRTARQRQAAWVADELGKPRTTPWLFVVGHHPVFSDGAHGDTKELVADLDPLLRRHAVDLYLCGHDHDLQHIEFRDHPTSFVVSGAGGARAREIRGARRGVFGRAVYGFTHLELHADRFTVRHVDANGVNLHAFTKNRRA